MTDYYLIRGTEEPRKIHIGTYIFETSGLSENDFPYEHELTAQEGYPLGLALTAFGIKVFIRHSEHYKEDFKYKLTLVLNDQEFEVKEGLTYLGSVEKFLGTIHVWHNQGFIVYK